MSWHCLFCGSAEAWMQGKEHEDGYGMIEIFVSDGLGGKKVSLGVCHADCFKRVLIRGQEELMQDGDIFEFEELTKFMKVDKDE
jgi:hypothetical protein